MALPLSPGLRPGIARQPQLLAHFSEHGFGLASRMHPPAPLGERLMIATLGMSDELHLHLPGAAVRTAVGPLSASKQARDLLRMRRLSDRSSGFAAFATPHAVRLLSALFDPESAFSP